MIRTRGILYIIAIGLVLVTILITTRNNANPFWIYGVLLVFSIISAEAALAYANKRLRKLQEVWRMERQAADKRYRMAIHHQVIQAQEQERRRISRELHDAIGQSLYSVYVGLKILGQLKIDSSVKEHLLEVERTTKEVMNGIKSMASQLRPPLLDELGLVPALRSYMESYEHQYGIRVEASLAPVGELDFSVTTALYRICQEAMLNAAKYADTPLLRVKLEAGEGLICLEVRDFGRGFDWEADKQQVGIGLFSMRERAELLEGSLEIASGAEGTVVTARIPSVQAQT